MVYGTKFGVLFLAQGPRTASMQEGFDRFGLHHSGLEGERDFRLVVELPSYELGFFLTKKKKSPTSGERLNRYLVHKIRLHGRRGTETAE